MKSENGNAMTVVVLMVAVVLLAADGAWLHVKCARQAEALAALEARVEAHLNPPSLTDRAKDAYERAKAATVKGYEKVKAAAARQYNAAKEKLSQD